MDRREHCIEGQEETCKDLEPFRIEKSVEKDAQHGQEHLSSQNAEVIDRGAIIPPLKEEESKEMESEEEEPYRGKEEADKRSAVGRASFSPNERSDLLDDQGRETCP